MSDDAAYDYVIAGGGSGGSVLAGRLSEDPSVRVLLLEAGRSDRHPFIHVPAGFPMLKGGPYQWDYASVPQKHSNGRRIPLAQGRVLGGGGSINSQVFTRGVDEDYDSGSGLWLRRLVLRRGRQVLCPLRVKQPAVGTVPRHRGPARCVRPVSPHQLSAAFVKAGQEFGLPYNSDFNGAEQYGVGFYQTTTKNGRRCSAAVAYLPPARKRPNLTVRANVTVSKVIISNGRAVGIQVIEGAVSNVQRQPRGDCLGRGIRFAQTAATVGHRRPGGPRRRRHRHRPRLSGRRARTCMTTATSISSTSSRITRAWTG